MARKKKMENGSKLSADDIIKNMQESFNTYTNDIVVDDDDRNAVLISTGIDVLDMLLGGGIAMNKLSLLVGDPGTFKSTFAAMMSSRFQKVFDKSIILYLDSEQAMSTLRLEQLGVKNVNPKTNLTVERVFATIQALMAFKEDNNVKDIPAFVIWDSIANTPTEADEEATNVNETLGLKARILSGKLPVIINKLREYNITLMFINQFRDKMNIGMFAPQSDLKNLANDKTLPGGNSPRFNSSQFLQMRVGKIIQQDTSPYGFRATVVKTKTVKDKYFPDGNTVELVVDPITGINNVYTNWEFLKNEGKVVSSAWSYLKNYPGKKLNGIKGLEKEYNENKDFREAFDEAVKEAIYEKRLEWTNNKLEFYDRYTILSVDRDGNPKEMKISDIKPKNINVDNKDKEVEEEATPLETNFEINSKDEAPTLVPPNN